MVLTLTCLLRRKGKFVNLLSLVWCFLALHLLGFCFVLFDLDVVCLIVVVSFFFVCFNNFSLWNLHMKPDTNLPCLFFSVVKQF